MLQLVPQLCRDCIANRPVRDPILSPRRCDSDVVASANCTACAAGQYGNTTGLSTSACSGSCSVGYACPNASTNATAVVCLAGKYSTGGQGVCTNCSVGQYSTVVANAVGCGVCPAGRYGSTTGLSTQSCSGNCSAGYFCPAGSTNSTDSMCPAGTYSFAGASACTPCPVGRYGLNSGLALATCSGNCSAGYYGNATGLTTSICSGPCPAGFACPAGSTAPVACLPGNYSVDVAAVRELRKD